MPVQLAVLEQEQIRPSMPLNVLPVHQALSALQAQQRVLLVVLAIFRPPLIKHVHSV